MKPHHQTRRAALTVLADLPAKGGPLNITVADWHAEVKRHADDIERTGGLSIQREATGAIRIPARPTITPTSTDSDSPQAAPFTGWRQDHDQFR